MTNEHTGVMRGARWRKSSHSVGENGCVELARSGSVFGVRDSKDPHGQPLLMTDEHGSAFLAAVKHDRFTR